jgi:hypothetical protein
VSGVSFVCSWPILLKNSCGLSAPYFGQIFHARALPETQIIGLNRALLHVNFSSAEFFNTMGRKPAFKM